MSWSPHWSFLVRLEIEIQPRGMLKFQRSLHAIGLAPDDHERGHEPDHVERVGKFVGGPDLAILGLQRRPAARLRIDFDQAFTTQVLGGLFPLSGHQKRPWIE